MLVSVWVQTFVLAAERSLGGSAVRRFMRNRRLTAAAATFWLESIYLDVVVAAVSSLWLLRLRVVVAERM